MTAPSPHITVYVNERSPEGICAATPWEKLAEKLSTITEVDCAPCPGKTCRAKFGIAWSPVRIEGSRKNDHVKAVTLAVVDIDDASNGRLAEIVARLEGCEYLMHSTHSHLHAGFGHNFLRLVMPLSREVLPEEWPRVLSALIHKYNLPADPSCKDLSRLYFLPTRPRGSGALVQQGRGVLLDVDALLRYSETMPTSTTSAPPTPPAASETTVASILRTMQEEEEVDGEVQVTDEDEVSVALLRKMLIAARRRKAKSSYEGDVRRHQLLTAVLEGTALAGSGGRSTTLNQTVAMIAHYIPADTAWEVVQEVLRPCVAAMPCEPGNPCQASCPNGCAEHWLRVAEQSYDRAMPRAKEHARQNAERKQADQYAQEALLTLVPHRRLLLDVTTGAPVPNSLSNAIADYASMMAKLTEGQPTLPPTTDEDAWRDHLIRTADNKLQPCPYNIYMILKNSQSLRNTIRFNNVTKKIEIHGGPFAGMSTSVLSTAMTDWFHKMTKLKLSKQEVEDRILLVAYENSYDPIADRLNSLVWDGVERLERFFLGYVKGRTTSHSGLDITEHLKRIGKMFFISAVARALRPGCQVDTMLVLEGLKEGEGKTKLLRLLFGEWYTVTRLNLNDKDSQMIPARFWGIELGELSSMRKSDDDIMKGFLTTTDDNFRPPYGRSFETFPRRCIFIGTTNEEQWLTPGKGRRRYWPVYVESIDLAAVERDLDQLWAEAVHRFKAGERWHLTDEERAEADAEADERVGETYVESKISAHWRGQSPKKRPEYLTIVDIVEDYLKMNAAERVGAPLLKDITQAMKKLGFKKERRTIDGNRLQVWVPTPAMIGQASTPTYQKLTPEDGFEAIANAKAPKPPKPEGGTP